MVSSVGIYRQLEIVVVEPVINVAEGSLDATIVSYQDSIENAEAEVKQFKNRWARAYFGLAGVAVAAGIGLSRYNEVAAVIVPIGIMALGLSVYCCFFDGRKFDLYDKIQEYGRVINILNQCKSNPQLHTYLQTFESLSPEKLIAESGKFSEASSV